MKLLDPVRTVARVRHLSIRTEACYVRWIEQFIRFSRTVEGFRYPKDLDAALEHQGTPPAQAHLVSLSQGDPDLGLTQEARDACLRLAIPLGAEKKWLPAAMGEKSQPPDSLSFPRRQAPRSL
jgi:hypothetical protein